MAFLLESPLSDTNWCHSVQFNRKNTNTVELQWLEHRWLVYHGYFELNIESLGKISIAADTIIFGIILGNFLFILKMVCFVYSLESPRWGDSNENTQHTFVLKKIEKISLLCLLTWRYDQHSLARTTPVSNIFSWVQRCSRHWSSTVYYKFIIKYLYYQEPSWYIIGAKINLRPYVIFNKSPNFDTAENSCSTIGCCPTSCAFINLSPFQWLRSKARNDK